MYDLRKQPPFCPLKNQVKRPGAALTRMTACCYKVKFCYFPPLSMQQPIARSTQKNSVWSPSYPLCHCPREFSKRNPDQDSTTISSLPTLHLNIGRDCTEKNGTNISQMATYSLCEGLVSDDS